MSTSAEAYHHGSLRDALLEEGLAALEGPEGAEPSLRELARRVGVSPTAVYRHFPDKQALTGALAGAGTRRLAAAQSEAAMAAPDLASGFAESGRAYVRFALRHPALFRLMFTQGQPGETSGEPDPARELLETMTAKLSASPEQAERLALQAWSIAHGIAMLMLDGRIPADDRLIDKLLDTGSLFPVQGSNSEESP